MLISFAVVIAHEEKAAHIKSVVCYTNVYLLLTQQDQSPYDVIAELLYCKLENSTSILVMIKMGPTSPTGVSQCGIQNRC